MNEDFRRRSLTTLSKIRVILTKKLVQTRRACHDHYFWIWSASAKLLIKTYLTKLLSAILRTPFKNDRVAFFSVIVFALSLLFVKGGTLSNQEGLFAHLLSQYIEETAAASVVQPSDNYLADINSVATQPHQETKSVLDLHTLQANSVFAYSSVLENLSSDFAGANAEVTTYTVQDGDTISFIASDFGVSIDTIVWANNLKSVDAIRPGTELKIPPVTGVLHVVKGGDTVATLAKKYSVTEDKIISFNNLPKNGELQVNDEIVVPDGKVPPPPAPIAAKIAKTSSGVVQRFVNLPAIAGYFGLPTNGFNWGRVHGRNGVDIANSCGTPIVASADGVVNLAKGSGYNGGFGKFVRITHSNGTETLYAHASQVLVGVGQAVAKGQRIALMGTTGRSTGCHLHFEVHGAKNPLAKR